MRNKKIFGLLVCLIAVLLSSLVFMAGSAIAASADTKGTKVYPGVYTAEEKQELDTFLKDLKPGFFGGPPPPPPGADDKPADIKKTGANQGGLASNETPQTSADAMMSMAAELSAMKLYAKAFDYWNPLYNNEEYAKKTRYGGLICVPFFKEAGAMFPTANLKKFGSWRGTNDGGDMEFFKPIYAGDSFTMKANMPEVKDTTPAKGSDSRVFSLSGSGDLYNQKGELVIRGTMYGRNIFVRGAGNAPGPGGPGGPPAASMKIHTYTDADWEKIHEIENKEVVRGAKTLYWEDVKVGDTPPWVINGPLTIMDMIQCFGMQVIQGLPMREVLKNADSLVGFERDQYGIYHVMEELHYGNKNNCNVTPIIFMAYGRSHMVRGITNYMGDDGWLRKFCWRNESLADDIIHEVPSMKGKTVNGHGKITDALISKYYVTKKYIEKGEYMVDIVTWMENFDGIICQAGKASVILPSKKAKSKGK